MQVAHLLLANFDHMRICARTFLAAIPAIIAIIAIAVALAIFLIVLLLIGDEIFKCKSVMGCDKINAMEGL